jgi:hypothetical protein
MENTILLTVDSELLQRAGKFTDNKNCPVATLLKEKGLEVSSVVVKRATLIDAEGNRIKYHIHNNTRTGIVDAGVYDDGFRTSDYKYILATGNPIDLTLTRAI